MQNNLNNPNNGAPENTPEMETPEADVADYIPERIDIKDVPDTTSASIEPEVPQEEISSLAEATAQENEIPEEKELSAEIHSIPTGEALSDKPRFDISSVGRDMANDGYSDAVADLAALREAAQREAA